MSGHIVVEPAGDVFRACTCQGGHAMRRVVITGGPGAGKTAALELVRRAFCEHVRILPEAASILFSGGFPRSSHPDEVRAVQRAIFHVQFELERWGQATDNPAIVLCDRGTIDGSAYWPGPGELWDDVHVSRTEELRRYQTVIHLRTPPVQFGYNNRNPVRTENAEEAARIDERILQAWNGHPRRFIIESSSDFFNKVNRVIHLLREEIPQCCGGNAPRVTS